MEALAPTYCEFLRETYAEPVGDQSTVPGAVAVAPSERAQVTAEIMERRNTGVSEDDYIRRAAGLFSRLLVAVDKDPAGALRDPNWVNAFGNWAFQATTDRLPGKIDSFPYFSNPTDHQLHFLNTRLVCTRLTLQRLMGLDLCSGEYNQEGAIRQVSDVCTRDQAEGKVFYRFPSCLKAHYRLKYNKV